MAHAEEVPEPGQAEDARRLNLSPSLQEAQCGARRGQRADVAGIVGAVPPLSAIRNVTDPYSALEAWGYDKFVGESAARQVLPVLNEALFSRLPPDARVLDVGCGGGHLLLQVARAHPSMTLAGIDLDPSQVTRARSRGRHLEDRMQIDEGSALALPHDDGTFDAVVSIASIKHWPDQARGLREILRVLAPGGWLYVVEVFSGCTLEEVTAFLATLPIPKLLHPVLAPQMRKLLQTGWTHADAGRLAEEVGIVDAVIERPPGPPTVALMAPKPR